jgi:hypothetical protein
MCDQYDVEYKVSSSRGTEEFVESTSLGGSYEQLSKVSVVALVAQPEGKLSRKYS